MTAAPAAEAHPRVQQVEEDYPGWHVFNGDTGRWLATRTAPDSRWDPWMAVPMTIDVATEAELRAELAQYPPKAA